MKIKTSLKGWKAVALVGYFWVPLSAFLKTRAGLFPCPASTNTVIPA